MYGTVLINASGTFTPDRSPLTVIQNVPSTRPRFGPLAPLPLKIHNLALLSGRLAYATGGFYPFRRLPLVFFFPTSAAGILKENARVNHGG